MLTGKVEYARGAAGHPLKEYGLADKRVFDDIAGKMSVIYVKVKRVNLRSACMPDIDPDCDLIRCKCRSEDIGTEARHSGSSDACDFTASGAFSAVEVESCLLAGELRDVAFGLVNARHGEASVDFIDGQRSVVTAATLSMSLLSAKSP